MAASLSFTLNDELLGKFSKLAKRSAVLAAELNGLPREVKDYIIRSARVSTIGASTRIENAVLPDAEIDWVDTTLARDARPTAFASHEKLIKNKLSKDRARSIEEVVGCRGMLGVVFDEPKELYPFSETALRGLHHELLRYYSAAKHHAGKYKTVPNSVIERNHRTGEQLTVLETTPPGPITEAAMRNLIDWYNEILPSSPWTMAVATEFVFRFLAIHPFQDGNGRIGRALFLLALLQGPDSELASVVPYISVDRQIERHKEKYYLTLRRCSDGHYHQDSTKYQLRPFAIYMIEMVYKALEDIYFYRRRFELVQNLAQSAATIFNHFREQPEISMQTGELERQTKMPRRTIVHALNQLLDAGLITRKGKARGTTYRVAF